MKKAAIKYVRFYNSYGTIRAEIDYESGRSRYTRADELPGTAAAWLEGKSSFEYWDVVLSRNETVYATDEDIEAYMKWAAPKMTVYEFLYSGRDHHREKYRWYMGAEGDTAIFVDSDGNHIATYAIPSTYEIRHYTGEQPDGATRIKNIRVHKDEHGKRTAYVEI